MKGHRWRGGQPCSFDPLSRDGLGDRLSDLRRSRTTEQRFRKNRLSVELSSALRGGQSLVADFFSFMIRSNRLISSPRLRPSPITSCDSYLFNPTRKLWDEIKRLDRIIKEKKSATND